MPGGGTLEPLERVSSGNAALTFVPALPLSPPEDVWMRTSEPASRRWSVRSTAHSLVDERSLAVKRHGDFREVEIARIVDHEVIVFAR